MKILIVSPRYYPYTYPATTISEALFKAGHEVDVLTTVPYKNNEYIEEYNKLLKEYNGIRVYRMKAVIRKKSALSLIRNYLSFVRKSKRWIRHTSNQYDFVYTYGVSPVTTLEVGNLYQKKHHVPHIAHVLDVWPESVVATGYTKRGSLLYQYLLRKSRHLYQEVDKILIGSLAHKEYIEKLIWPIKKEIGHLPQLATIEESKDITNPFDTKKTNIIYCGNITKLQLLDVMVEAMREYNNKDVILNIVGNGNYLASLLEKIEKYKLSNVTYRGYCSPQESYRYLINADAIIVSLKNEGFVGKTVPNKLISSLYFAKPIIGMIENEGRDILLNSGGSFVCGETKEDFIKVLDTLTNTSSEDKENMGKKNRQYYDDHFSSDKFVEKLLSSFSSK